MPVSAVPQLARVHAEEADKEAAYHQQLAEAIAPSSAVECVVPPSLKPEPTKPQEVYEWTDCVREFVSASSMWLGATPQQEQSYLKHWRTKHLRAERVEAFG
ncbi:hypothetical protein D1007_14379 [Hordeum vulgare]|nr:hypothetical protein D1007_14379 [Hordeum vulgare]